MKLSPKRVAGPFVTVVLVSLVATDLWAPAIQRFWNRHSLTSSVVSGVLVLAVTALVVDEVIARRQRKERAVSVAVQALIVYGQARRVWHSIVADGGPDVAGEPSQELRTLAGMLLTASPSLFDDPDARLFLEATERFSAAAVQLLAAARREGTAAATGGPLASAMGQMQTAVSPMLARLPARDRDLLQGPSEDPPSPS